MVFRIRSLAACALALLLAVALVASAWNARPLRLAEEVALEQFVLAGGAVSDLCDETGTVGKTGPRHDHDCPRCCLAGGAVLLPPGPAALASMARGTLLRTAGLEAMTTLPAAGWAAAHPRAPPAGA